MADLTVTTQAVKLRPLSLQEAALSGGFTHIATIKGSDINAVTGTAGDTITVTLGTSPTEYLITKAAVYVETAFTIGSSGTLTVMAGSSGTPNAILTATDALTQGGIATESAGDPEAGAGTVGTSAITLVARFTTATGTPGSIGSTGKLHVLLGLVNLAALAN
jgi:hypothetical protein